jgi:glyoxylate reductase
MAKIYVCRNWFPEVIERLTKLHETKIWKEDSNPPRNTLLREVKDIEGLLCLGSDVINSEIINAAPKLKVISTFSNGYNNIDVATATERSIIVGHSPYVVTETTADLTFGLLLASARRIVEGDAFVRQGKWKKASHLDLPGVDVNNTTLGIVGLGKIGMQVAKRARAFNMRVFYYDMIRKEDIEKLLGIEYVSNLHDLLSISDFITILVNLDEQSKHMIGSAEFAVMKPTAILINASRGPVVDQRALYQALRSRQILRAALDVTEVAPIPLNDPLLTLDNVIIMPHIGTAIPGVRKQMMAVAVENLIIGLRGDRIPYCANPGVYKGFDRL